MKKRMILVVAVILSFTLTGCVSVFDSRAIVSYDDGVNYSGMTEEKMDESMHDYAVDYSSDKQETAYDYSESDGYDVGYDGGYYEDYGYDGGYDGGYYGEYERYEWDYGTFIARDDQYNNLAYVNVTNYEGAVTVDLWIDRGESPSLSLNAYMGAEDCFGHASRNTLIEMTLPLDDENFSYSESGIAGGTLYLTVYNGPKAELKLVCGNGRTYSYTLYKD